MARRYFILGAVVALHLALGCGSDPKLNVGSVSESIVAGEPDTTHDAVVYLRLSGGSCSGTIFRVDPVTSVGYVLTAAHCFNDNASARYISVGPSPDSPSLTYFAIDSLRDSRYPTDLTRDLAVVRVAGVDATTRVMPLLEPADAAPAVGETGTVVGYGVTDADYDTNSDPLLRRRIDMQVVSSVSPSILVSGYGDLCFGDSGGPFVVERAGAEYAASVASGVDGSCFLAATEALVNPTFGDQLAAFVDGPVPQSCERCVAAVDSGTNTCAGLSQKCAADTDCSAMRRCATACDGEIACYRSCTSHSGPSRDLFFSLSHCGCDACKVECQVDDGLCASLPPAEKEPVHVPSPPVAAGASGGCRQGRGFGTAGRSVASWVVACAVSGLALRRRRRSPAHRILEAPQCSENATTAPSAAT